MLSSARDAARNGSLRCFVFRHGGVRKQNAPLRAGTERVRGDTDCAGADYDRADPESAGVLAVDCTRPERTRRSASARTQCASRRGAELTRAAVHNQGTSARSSAGAAAAVHADDAGTGATLISLLVPTDSEAKIRSAGIHRRTVGQVG